MSDAEPKRQKKDWNRQSDKFRNKLIDNLIPVIMAVILWFIKIEVSKHMVDKRLSDLERKEQVRWEMIETNKVKISALKNESENHSQRADEAIKNSEKNVVNLRMDVYRLEDKFMEAGRN